MVRLIKRYESRKLYDTEESRYVSLEEIAEFIRRGQEVRVIDNSTSDDVTTQTLAQVVLDEGRSGRSVLPSELMHELVRFGEQAFSSGVEQVQQGVDKFVQASIDRLAPVRQAREEMTRLRARLEELEASLSSLEEDRDTSAAAAKPAARKRRVAKKAAPANREVARGTERAPRRQGERRVAPSTVRSEL